MLTAGRVLSVAKKGTGATVKTILTILTLVSVLIGLVGFIIRAIWFKVEFGHVVVMMRNQKVKFDNEGMPIVKEAGWRCQVPIRDDMKAVDCTDRTSELKPQDITAGDAKNGVTVSIDWHVLSLRDGEKFRRHPVRTLIVQDLNQRVEEICRNAVREVMGTSDKPASKWKSEDLYEAVKPIVKKPLLRVGVRLDSARLPDAAPSEAETHGQLVLSGLKLLAGQPDQIEAPDESTEKEFETYPGPHAIPS